MILSGGELRHPKDAMVGDFALRNLQTIYAKKAFVGCSGISAQTGMEGVRRTGLVLPAKQSPPSGKHFPI